jgi:hypothetical protein
MRMMCKWQDAGETLERFLQSQRTDLPAAYGKLPFIESCIVHPAPSILNGQ